MISLPSRSTTLHTAETLAIGAVGGAIFTLLGFPAGLVSGSLLAVAAAGLAGRPMQVPRRLTQVIMVLVGVLLGGVVTPETLGGLASFPVSIAILLVATAALTFATTSYLHFVHGWDARSALLGASPGAMAQVMLLSTEYGADMRKIAIVQVVRVVLLTIGIPLGLSFFGLTAHGVVLPGAETVNTTSVLELAALIGISAAVAVIFQRFGVPGSLLFGAMMASGFLHGTGLVAVTLPWWVASAAIIGIGAVTGSRFANTDPRTLVQYIGAAFGSFAVALLVASVFVVVLTMLIPVPIADVVVAFSPGAQDTMMVLALALALDPVFVGAHHLARYILVSVSLPILVHRLGGGPPKVPPAEARSPTQPTIVD